MNRETPPFSSDTAGFSLVEALIAVALMSGVGMLLTSTFTFALVSRDLARQEQEACRSAGQILEVLRSTSYDALVFVEDGNLQMDPLGKFQQQVLLDIQDRLARADLKVYLTIRKNKDRDTSKLIHLVIASTGVSPHSAIEETPPGKILVKQTTLVTKKGINP